MVGTLQAWRSRSGMLVGPGMKTGFWLDMGSLRLVAKGVAGGWRISNFFEIIFHLGPKMA
jgi:hypothetical protein